MLIENINIPTGTGSRAGHVDLAKMTESEKAAWYANVMRDRMVRLEEALSPATEDPEVIVARALAVASWSLAVAGRHLDLGHVRSLVSSAGSAVTMAQHPVDGDAVTLTWGSRAT